MFYVGASIICGMSPTVSYLLVWLPALISPPAGQTYNLLKATEPNTEMTQDFVFP